MSRITATVLISYDKNGHTDIMMHGNNIPFTKLKLALEKCVEELEKGIEEEALEEIGIGASKKDLRAYYLARARVDDEKFEKILKAID